MEPNTIPCEEPVEFSMAVLCYHAEESIIPFVENLHRMMMMFKFRWEMVLVANYWPQMQDKTPAYAKQLSSQLPGVRYIARPKEGHMGWDMKSGLDAWTNFDNGGCKDKEPTKFCHKAHTRFGQRRFHQDHAGVSEIN